MDPYFTLNNVALMLSKLAQVVVPLVIYVLLRNIGRRTHVVGRFVEKRFAGSSFQERNEWKDRITRAFDRLGGFLGWKVGCDLGYFVITGHSVWQAFTLAGLIPYTVVQYLVYRIFCQKMLFSGMTNPFAYERYRMPRLSRRRNVRRFLAKFLHEDCNATSGNVPLRRVFLKPFGDFFAVVLAWSAYTMGIFWLQDGELNWQPVTQFSYVMMGGYYLGGILAYIWGYNLGEWGFRQMGQMLYKVEPDVSVVPYWRRAISVRLRDWREFYSIRPLHLGAAVVGIVMVWALTAPIQMTFTSVSQAVQGWAFSHWGERDPQRVLQMGAANGTQPPPFSQAAQAYRALLAKPNPQQ